MSNVTRVLMASIVVLLGVAVGTAVVKEPEEAPVAALPAPESPAPAVSPEFTAPPSPALAESPVPAEAESPAVEPAASPTLPRTGDGFSPWGALLVALALAGAGLAIARRRSA